MSLLAAGFAPVPGHELAHFDRHFDGLRVFLGDGCVEIGLRAVENFIIDALK